jgi:hypothetical protein
VSEAISVLEACPEVDFVARLDLTSTTPAARAMWHDSGDLVGLELGPYALPQLGPLALGHNVWTAGQFARIDVAVHARPAPGVAHADVRAAVKRAVDGFFDPAAGGPNGTDPWGPVPVAALQTAIEVAPGVLNLREPLAPTASPPGRVAPDSLGDLQISAADGELVEVETTVTVH